MPVTPVQATLVAVAALPVQEPELPVTFPVTFPVSGPEKEGAVTLPPITVFPVAPATVNTSLPPSSASELTLNDPPEA